MFRILLDTHDKSTRRRWRQILSDLDCRIVVATDSETGPIDVLLTDRAETASTTASAAEGEVIDERVGVVSLHPDRCGDAELPYDASPGELRLACRLVAQIAQLRHQLAAATEQTAHFADLAYLDPLTQISNRRAWKRECNELAACDPKRSVCIAILDIDFFKQINDQHGHDAGDDCLREVAGCLRDNVRGRDLAVRLGGDEFGLLLVDLPATAARKVVERIRQAAAVETFEEAVRLSAGYAVGTAKELETLLTEADRQLRRAKQAGRNRTAPEL